MDRKTREKRRRRQKKTTNPYFLRTARFVFFFFMLLSIAPRSKDFFFFLSFLHSETTCPPLQNKESSQLKTFPKKATARQSKTNRYLKVKKEKKTTKVSSRGFQKRAFATCALEDLSSCRDQTIVNVDAIFATKKKKKKKVIRCCIFFSFLLCRDCKDERRFIARYEITGAKIGLIIYVDFARNDFWNHGARIFCIERKLGFLKESRPKK